MTTSQDVAAVMAVSVTDAVSVVDAFGAATAARDVDAMMALMTDDCVFESTSAPDGERVVGQAAVRAAWERLFASAENPRFTTEQRIPAGDIVIEQWRYDWDGPDAGHVRGIDVFRVEDGRVAEKRSYVKG